MDCELGQTLLQDSQTPTFGNGIPTCSQQGAPWTQDMVRHAQCNKGFIAGNAPHNLPVGVGKQNTGLPTCHVGSYSYVTFRNEHVTDGLKPAETGES